MSFFDCVKDAMDEGSVDRERGKRAQDMWKELSDRYERQGHDRHMAEGLAAEDVKAAFHRAAGEDRHVYLSRMANIRKQQAEVAAAKTPDMQEKMERLDYRHRGLVRRFNGRLADFLREHHRDLLGNLTKPAQMRNIVRELHGEASGDATAKALSEGIRDALEDMRLMFNEAGGLIGKLENWGLPHVHSRGAVTKAGFDRWSAEVAPRLDWTRINDPLTGKPMQPEGGSPPDARTQQAFLKEVYDNIAFGKESREAIYGRPQGVATYRKHSERRILIFKSADDWIDYNKQFGSGDPFKSLMGHVHRMARDIALMREFGPNPGLGAEYRGQLWAKKARGDQKLTEKAQHDTHQGLKMLRVMDGGNVPQTVDQEWWATFFSSTRHVLTSAFLDRAIVASISDVNSMRLAAEAVGMNPGNLLKRHIDLLVNSMSREEAMRAGWVADTLSDAGTALARFQQEVPPAEIAERLASASMRLQGLSHWTDMGRTAFQMEFAGHMAAQAGKRLDEVDQPLQGFLKRAGITDDEWLDLTSPENLFRAGNGGTFASPMWWRETTKMDRRKADDLFMKIQGLVEEQMEFAVPTQSLLARSRLDPAAYNLVPGTFLYEVAKSGLMFKSFAMTFTVNQYRRLMSFPTIGGRIGYGINLAAGATVMGAIALQIGDLALGRDPQDMTTPQFWGRAAMKGGGFGMLGDIVATGAASWGGGYPAYLAGPVVQTAADGYDLILKNAYEFATGQETKFGRELGRIGKRYMPMGQTPAIGPALDRLFWDQLSILLDPEAADALVKASKRRANLNGGNADWWMPGSLAPSRAPNLGNILGR